MITMIDFKHLFESSAIAPNQQKKVETGSLLGVYYGYSSDGYCRLSFLSKNYAPQLESTKNLRVTQGKEADGIFWTCFDLLNGDMKSVFYTFCGNIVESISNVSNELSALNALKKRYISWKSMFKGVPTGNISREILQGLYGELYFISHFMLDKYGSTTAINAWSGPDSKSKDFSINQEWYEIKTVGANATTIHISSLSQLSSPYVGHLAVIKVEAMSQEFDNGEACIKDLFESILCRINDETVEGVFLGKISSYGVDLSDACCTEKFCVKSFDRYMVDDHFPKMREDDIPYSEICDVKYSLVIGSLRGFLEE